MSSEELRVICARLGWNYSRMARELGVSIKTVCNWASNAHPISGPAVIAIQKIFQDNFETQYDSIENHYVAR